MPRITNAWMGCARKHERASASLVSRNWPGRSSSGSQPPPTGSLLAGASSTGSSSSVGLDLPAHLRHHHHEGTHRGDPAEKLLRELRLNRNRTIPISHGRNRNNQTQADTVLEEEGHSHSNTLIEGSMRLPHETDAMASVPVGRAREPEIAAGDFDPECRSTSYGSSSPPPPYSAHHGDTYIVRTRRPESSASAQQRHLLLLVT